jgi:hypothetical protein
VVGHPGHELRLFGWISEYRPRVYVLTDGSGRQGVSRVPATARLLAGLGAEPGEICGALSDAELYAAVLRRDTALFLGLLDRLADFFARHRIDLVAGDAAEGYNPAHDLCRTLLDGAALMARPAAGPPLPNYEVSLTEWKAGCRAVHDQRCWHFSLDDALLGRKLDAAEAYEEMKGEVQDGLRSQGREYFRVECLRQAAPACPRPGKPFYETWGEQRVAGGEYASVIRWQEHMRPLVEAIQQHAACLVRPS